jgi:cell division topological specificity factor
MNFFSRWFAPRAPEETTAPVARERLQVLLAHERQKPGEANLLGLIKDDIVAAITRHVDVGPKDVKVKVERRKTISTMRISLDLPA